MDHDPFQQEWEAFETSADLTADIPQVEMGMEALTPANPTPSIPHSIPHTAHTHGQGITCQHCHQTTLFLSTMMRRLEAIESCLLGVSPLRHLGLAGHAQSTFPPAQPAAPTAPISHSMELVMSGVVDSFVTDRKFPSFSIQIRRTDTKQAIRDTPNWQLRVRLVNGYGVHVDEKLDDEKTKQPFLVDGTADVSGIRFKDVSSTNGKFYKLQCELLEPSYLRDSVRKAISQKIEIKSSRCREKSFSKLQASDVIGKMPGIGRQYAQRFTAMGFKTIHDLAQLHPGVEGYQERKNLLDGVRREKGTMTEAKLKEYIRTAQAIANHTDEEEMAQLASLATSSPSLSSPAPSEHRSHMPSPQESTIDVSHPHPFDASQQPEAKRAKLDAHHGAGPEYSQLEAPVLETPVHCTAPPSPLGLFPTQDMSAECADLFGDAFFNFDTEKSSAEWQMPLPDSLPEASDTNRAQAMGPGPSNPLSLAAGPLKYPLHTAVSTGNQELSERVMKTLRRRHTMIDQLNDQQLTPLMLACAMGRAGMVGMLCALPEVDPAFARKDGLTALHIAVFRRHMDCVRLLMKDPRCRVGVNLQRKRRASPLMMAVLQGDAAIVEELVTACGGKEGDWGKGCVGEMRGYSLYHMALLSGDLATISYVHELTGPEVSPTHLICAADSGSPDAVRFALDKGADPNGRDENGFTALHVAASRQSAECVDVLREAGADVNAKADSGETVMEVLMQSPDSLKRDACADLLVLSPPTVESPNI